MRSDSRPASDGVTTADDCARARRSTDNASTVLVADDDEDSRLIITLALESEGFRVAVATNADEALRLLQTSDGTPPCALVLLDLWLPHTEGERVVDAIRGNPALSSIPIVALTTWALGPERQRVERTRCNTVLLKPIAPALVCDAVRGLIAQRQQRRSSRG